MIHTWGPNGQNLSARAPLYHERDKLCPHPESYFTYISQEKSMYGLLNSYQQVKLISVSEYNKTLPMQPHPGKA